MPTIIKDGVLTQITPEEYKIYTREQNNLNYGDDGKWIGIDDPKLGTVKINGQEFQGLSTGGLMSVNTKTYVTEPTRANDGSIPNINDYEVFFVPRCTLNFKYFSIQDYQRFCIAIQPNEFYVEFFDKQYGKRMTYKMYVEPEDMANIFNIDTKVIGVRDFPVSLIGTLNDVTQFKIQYNINGGGTSLGYATYNAGSTWDLGDIVESTYGSNVFYKCIYNGGTLGQPLDSVTYWRLLKNDVIKGKYLTWGTGFQVVSLSDIQDIYTITGGNLLSFNTKANGTGFTFNLGQSAVLFDNLTLYAIWE